MEGRKVTPESPKTRFLKSALAKEHVKLLENPLLQQGFDVALLQMANDYGSTSNATDAAAVQLRMEGARKLVYVFMTLSDKPQPLPAVKGDNLPNQNLK